MSAGTTVRRCELRDLFTVADGGDDVVAPVAAYFARFCAPIVPETASLMAGARCLCGAIFTGLLGTFRYGLAHGEGQCGACGHPARADHYVRDASGEEVVTLNRFPLLYHPDELTPREEPE